MSTTIILAIYILGVYTAYIQVQKWANHEVKESDEYQTLHMLSLLSWFIYPLYFIVWLIRKAQEE